MVVCCLGALLCGWSLVEGTARDTGGGGRDDDTTIACVVESRSREVCIAVMSSRHLYILQVYLLTDTQSYSETIDLLEYLAPHEIVVPER